MKSILENRPALAAEVNKVAEVAGYLWQKGWAERNGGNITVNITEFVDDEIRRVPAFGQAPGELYLFVARRGREVGDLMAGRSGFGDVLAPARREPGTEQRYQQKVDYLFHASSDLK